MKPRRTPESNRVFSLEGGTEDNDLWLEAMKCTDGAPKLVSVWEFNDEEREAIAAGAQIELHVWGNGHPPVALAVAHRQLGAPKP